MHKKVDENILVDTWKASELTDWTRKTLETYRSRKKYNLRWIKKPNGRIYYLYADLMKFKEDETKHF